MPRKKKEAPPPEPEPKSRINKIRTMDKLMSAQRRLETWEKRLARAATTVVSLRAEVRRHWKRLETAGAHVDPMMAEDDQR